MNIFQLSEQNVYKSDEYVLTVTEDLFEYRLYRNGIYLMSFYSKQAGIDWIKAEKVLEGVEQ